MSNDSFSAGSKVVDAEIIDENEPSIKDKLLSVDHWLRFVFMLLFMFIAGAAGYVVFTLIVIQFIFALVSGGSDPRLQAFGSSLSQYIFQILTFLTYNSEEKPFPFRDWPAADIKENND